MRAHSAVRSELTRCLTLTQIALCLPKVEGDFCRHGAVAKLKFEFFFRHCKNGNQALENEHFSGSLGKLWNLRRRKSKEELSTAVLKQFWQDSTIFVGFIKLRVRTVDELSRKSTPQKEKLI